MPKPKVSLHGISPSTRGDWYHRQSDAIEAAQLHEGFLSSDFKSAQELGRPGKGPVLLVSFDKKPVDPGSEWVLLKNVTPRHELLENDLLSRRLGEKLTFSPDEVSSFDFTHLHANHYAVATNGKRYRPVFTNPMSKFFGVYDVEQYIDDLEAQADNQRHWYEIICKERKACLYFDLECEEAPDSGNTLEQVRDPLFCTVKEVYAALGIFCQKIGVDGNVKVEIAESSREKADGTKKASFHMIVKSLHFANNVQDSMMEFFVYAIKHYIHDYKDHIDIAVNYRILWNSKRGDSSVLKKVNVGDSVVLQYDYDAQRKAELSADQYRDLCRQNIANSLVSNVYADSVEITKEHVCMFEEFVAKARIGLEWVTCKPAPATIQSDILCKILEERRSLTRAELDAVCSEMHGLIPPKSRVIVTTSSGSTTYRPLVQNSKRFMNVKGRKPNSQKRTTRPVQAEDSEPGPSAKVVKTEEEGEGLPLFFQKIFCDHSSKVKRNDKEGHEWFSYVKDCLDMDVIERVDKFYIENPIRCPLDWCTGCRSGLAHRSNNLICCKVKLKAEWKSKLHDDAEEEEEEQMFAYCLDQKCREAFKDSIYALYSGHGICSMQTNTFPSVYTKAETKTATQKYFMTPFQFKDIKDGYRREKLLKILQKPPAEMKKLMSGDGPGRLNRNAYFEFLGKSGWVKICERKKQSFLAGR